MDKWDQQIRHKVKQARPYQPQKNWERMEQMLDEDAKKGIVPLFAAWWPYAVAASFALLLAAGWWFGSNQSKLNPVVTAEQGTEQRPVHQGTDQTANSQDQVASIMLDPQAADMQDTLSGKLPLSPQSIDGSEAVVSVYTQLQPDQDKSRLPLNQISSVQAKVTSDVPDSRLALNNQDGTGTGDLVLNQQEGVRQHIPAAGTVPSELRGELRSISPKQYQLVGMIASHEVSIHESKANWWENLDVSFPPLPEVKPQKGWAMELYAGTQSAVGSSTSLSAFEFGMRNDQQSAPVNNPDPLTSGGDITVELVQQVGTSPVATVASWGPSIGLSLVRDFSPRLTAGLSLNWNSTLAPLGQNMFGTTLMDGQYVNLNWNTQFALRKRTQKRVQPFVSGGLGFAFTETDITFAQLGQANENFMSSADGLNLTQSYNRFLQSNEIVDATALGGSYVLSGSESFVLLTESNKYIFYASGTLGVGTHVRLSSRLNLKLGSDLIFNSPLGQTGTTEIISDPLRLLFRATGGLQLAL